jgi:hypothetical protein
VVADVEVVERKLQNNTDSGKQKAYYRCQDKLPIEYAIQMTIVEVMQLVITNAVVLPFDTLDVIGDVSQ